MSDEEQKTFKLSMRQLVSLISACTILAGGGAGITVKASDQIQDRDIASNTAAVRNVRDKLSDVEKVMAELGGTVKAVDAQVERSEQQVRGDIQELRKLLIEVIKEMK